MERKASKILGIINIAVILGLTVANCYNYGDKVAWRARASAYEMRMWEHGQEIVWLQDELRRVRDDIQRDMSHQRDVGMLLDMIKKLEYGLPSDGPKKEKKSAGMAEAIPD